MLRRLAKTGMACALHWTGSDRLIGALAGIKNLPLVLCYHRVVEDFDSKARSSIPAMLIGRKMLGRHLDWIGRRFRFVSLDELGLRLERGEAFDGPTAVVTFDDGYSDVYHHAFPLLKRKGIPAAVFVVTGLIGTWEAPIHDRLYLLLLRAFSIRHSAPKDLARLVLKLGVHPSEVEIAGRKVGTPFMALRFLLNRLTQTDLRRMAEILKAEVGINESALRGPSPLNWEMLTEMHRAGITIGSHTKTHAWLTREDPQKMTDEITGSRQELERRLGITIRHLAYPDGRFNPAVLSAVAASGYRFGYTCCLHRDPVFPLLTIPRRVLWENSCLDALGRFSSAVMSCQANRVFDFAAGCRQAHHFV